MNCLSEIRIFEIFLLVNLLPFAFHALRISAPEPFKCILPHLFWLMEELLYKWNAQYDKNKE